METERELIIPGETIREGDDYLPGEGTEKRGKAIVSLRYGVVEESGKLIKIIPVSGVYIPRRGNVVIGKVTNVTFNGWVFDINTPQSSFLPLMEVPRFVNKDEIDEVMTLGDMAILKIWNINKRGIDLSIKSKGLGRIDSGIIVSVNPNKIPRVIGKEGSMIAIIKEATGCEITAGQNGLVHIEGKTIDDELLAKKAILFVAENSLKHGLSELLTKFLKEQQ